jgi:hypothetical protein
VAVEEFGLHEQYPAFTRAVDDHYYTMMYALRSLRRAALEEEKDSNQDDLDANHEDMVVELTTENPTMNTAKTEGRTTSKGSG